MDVSAIRISDKDERLFAGKITTKTEGPESKEGTVSENGMVRAVAKNREKSEDFLAERVTSDSREELRIKARAVNNDDKLERQIEISDYRKQENMNKVSDLNRQAADVENEKNAVIAAAAKADEMTPDEENEKLADLESRLREIEQAKNEAEKTKASVSEELREKSNKGIAEGGIKGAVKEFNEKKLEAVREDKKEMGKDFMKSLEEANKEDKPKAEDIVEISTEKRNESGNVTRVSQQERLQGEVLNMIGNMRIASDDAKGIQYSSTI